ncbi:hypothetical protein [Halobacterium sp. R2-5]|nr:hypothetical protein [Halobacterium sp. R2-5]NIB98430.1 hypothetical protein [Halobacterium sp. R2-5]
MPHSPSRGLLYTAPPTPESNRREDAEDESASADADAPEATDAAPAAADD